jgi:hypothetical protein
MSSRGLPCLGTKPLSILGASSEPCNAAGRSGSTHGPMELAVAFQSRASDIPIQAKGQRPCFGSQLAVHLLHPERLARLLPRIIVPCRQRTGYWDQGWLQEIEGRTVNRDKLHAPCHVSGRTADYPTAIPGTRILSTTATTRVVPRSGCTKIAGSGCYASKDCPVCQGFSKPLGASDSNPRSQSWRKAPR